MAKVAPDRNLEPVLDAAKLWVDTCLVDDGSILSKDALWTSDNASELRRAFVERPDERKKVKFQQKLEQQLADVSPAACKLMAEMRWALLLFPSDWGIKKKRNEITSIWQYSGTKLDEKHPLLSDAILAGVGSAKPGFNTSVPFELGFLVELTYALKQLRRKDRLGVCRDYDAHTKWVRRLPRTRRHQFRHMLRYFLFPDRVERIASDNHRRQILVANGIAPDSAVLKWQKEWKEWEVDDALRRIRVQHESGNPEDVLDFYYPPLLNTWRNDDGDTTPAVDLSRAHGFQSPPHESSAASVETILTTSRTHAALLYGPAGTGKTFHTEEIADLYRANKGMVQTVQFHPAYAYEDFIIGLKPESTKNGVAYPVKPGVFKKFCDDARSQPGPHLFIIDEINRGNIAKVFGELMYCLEYRVEPDDTSPTDNKGKPGWIKLPYAEDRSEWFSIPDNVHILGTMNSSDRSVALLDVALRRRFHFVELPPRPDLAAKVTVEGSGLNLGNLLDSLNRDILKEKGRHYLLGHSYFLPHDFDEDEGGELALSDLKLRWFHQILPLLEEYFADDIAGLRKVVGTAWEDSGRKDHDHFIPLTPDMDDEKFVAALEQLAANEVQPITVVQPEDE